MKIIEKNIFPFQEDDFFSAIRYVNDYAKILLLVCRYLLLDNNEISSAKGVTCNAQLKLCISKMSRLFFIKRNKHFSIAFPFTSSIENQQLKSIYTRTGREVNFKSISQAIRILDDDKFKMHMSLNDFFLNTDEILDEGVNLLEEIFQSEASYIRYDIDEKNENGNLHPLHHIDINYSEFGKIKIGLEKQIDCDIFQDILDTNTESHFLKKADN